MRRVVVSFRTANTRGFVSAFYRLPPQQLVPTHAPNGEPIDTDLFLKQIKHMFAVLQQTQLIERVHEMKSLPYFDGIFTADISASMNNFVLLMPKYGRENRSAEMSETMRYMRGCGSANQFSSALQDVQGSSAHGGDFVTTPNGLLMGWGTSRTNKIAMEAMSGGANGEIGAVSVSPIEQRADAAPLGDLIGFCGTRTLIVQDSPDGMEAAQQAAMAQNKTPWNIVKVNAGCFTLSFVSGSTPVYDVLCDQDFPESLENIGENGLNPFPVEWSEPRKLGISMRSVCLVGRFAVGGMSAGGFKDGVHHNASHRNYTSKNAGKNSRILHGGHKRYGDQGAPLEAQLRSGELPSPEIGRAHV